MFFPVWQLIFGVVAFIVLLFIFYKFGNKIGSVVTDNNWKSKIPGLRKEIANSSRSIIKGQVSEQLAPYLPNFPFRPDECKFLGNPIDFIVFKNLEDGDDCSVHFVEVKSGKSRLNGHERNLKKAIQEKKVYWSEYRVDG